MQTLIIFGGKYLFLLSIILVLYFLYQANSDTRNRLFKLGSISLPLTYLLGLLARSLYENPRPFVVEGLTPLIEHLPDNGFPSDHTLLLASLASLMFLFNKKLAITLWAVTFLVGMSRVLALVHHSLDILGSIVISITAIAMIYWWDKHKTNATNIQ